MAESCIVCLGDLRTSTIKEEPDSEVPDGVTPEPASLSGDAKRLTRSDAKRYHFQP